VSKFGRVAALLTIIAGALMVVVGIGAYVVTSNQLSSQNIKVAAVTADNPGSMAGEKVAGPFTALAEVNAIAHHIDAITGGKTYGELGNVATSDGQTYNKDVTAEASTDGQAHSQGDKLSDEDATTYRNRNMAQQSSFLRASLFTSVLAFGVSAFIAGTGVVFVLVGVTQNHLVRKGDAA
jgi:hypothetical protein